MSELSKPQRLVSLAAAIIAALILLQTLFFKFTGAPESIYIFETLGMEPWGRIGSGIAELAAGILLLIPSTAALGGVIAAGVMVGAIASHLTKLGIEVQGDGGLLFAMACLVLLCSVTVVWIRRRSLPVVGKRF